MLPWLNLFNLQNCDLNSAAVDWLGIEKESLSAEYVYELKALKPHHDAAFKTKPEHDLRFSYKKTN